MAPGAPRNGLLSSSRLRWAETLSHMAGTSRHRFRPLKHAPSRILGLLVRSRNEEQRQRYARALESSARQRSERLPIVTLQMWLRRLDVSKQAGLSDAINSILPARWEDTLRSMAARGWTEDNLKHWIWILSGENGDVRVERFLSSEEKKPIFLIHLLLRSDEIFREPQSLLSIMDYVLKRYITANPRSSTTENKLTTHKFLVLLSRLILHIQRVAPRSIVTVARFAEDYIKAIPRHFHRRTYRYQCSVFNMALLMLKKQSPNQPLLNMEFNWRAQKYLLAMSENLDKPLIINKKSYRAIRQVILGLKKSREEKMVARRYAKSWPPYRQDFDGLDAERTPEDDYTRSFKAGRLMTEAGYEKDDYDRALDTMGGTSDESPTIQTRTQPLKEWEGEKENINLYTNWASNIRATRNPQEAWRAFRKFAEKTGALPNIQVYGEMFIKLLAERVDPDLDPVPGDSRENLPIHDANYSSYELARLAPPTVTELYNHMINRGIKPEGHYLYKLVSNARSVEEGIGYLADSNLNPDGIRELTLFKETSRGPLLRVPLLAFNSYIHLLSRIQPFWQFGRTLPTDELVRIRRAIELVNIRLVPGTTEGATFRPPWYIILRALARPYIAVTNGTESENDFEAMVMFMDVLRRAQKAVGLDAEFLILFGRIVQKTAMSHLKDLPSAQPIMPDTGELPPSMPLAQNVLQALQTLFATLTTPEKLTYGEITSVIFKQPIGPVHLHTYMRALASLDARDAMIDLAFWILNHWRYIENEAERIGPRGASQMAKTLCAFHAFAGPGLSDEEKAKLDAQMDRVFAKSSFWRWPTPEEVETYVQVDKRGASQKLRQRVLNRSWYNPPQQGMGTETGGTKDIGATA